MIRNKKRVLTWLAVGQFDRNLFQGNYSLQMSVMRLHILVL